MHAAYRTNPNDSTPQPKKGGVSAVHVLVGAGVVGFVGYLLLKPRTARAAGIPAGSGTGLLGSGAGGGAGAGGGSPTPNPTYGPNGQDASPALVARLRGSDPARQIFALQAMAYSYGFTNAVPDGIEGTATDNLISALTGASVYGPGVLAQAKQTLDRLEAARAAGGTPPPHQFLPFTLPADVASAVNASALSADPNAAPILTLPTETAAYCDPSTQSCPQPAPAGQVIPVAGYSRPPSLMPFNSVGGSPGYGVITDPNGYNIGLWEALAGWQHGPLGTGLVAADVGRNPIAGQGGLYPDGYPYLRVG